MVNQPKPQRFILFALPARFYWESSTSMGTQYQVAPRDVLREQQPIRWSWSDVERETGRGNVVEIQPADAEMWRWAEAKLAEVKAAGDELLG